MRSWTTVWLSSCGGMPVWSKARCPWKFRVWTTSVSNLPPPLVDPSADGMADAARLDVGRPVAAVGVDASMQITVRSRDVSGVGRDDECQRIVGGIRIAYRRKYTDNPAQSRDRRWEWGPRHYPRRPRGRSTISAGATRPFPCEPRRSRDCMRTTYHGR
jgi:hypothetical protein